MPPPARRLPYRQLLAIVLAQAFALFVHAWLARALVARGYDGPDARHFAYLVVPPVLLLLLAPLLARHRDFLLPLFSPRATTLRIVLAAAALGVTMRMLWWSQLIAGISFGMISDGRAAITPPVIGWACPPLDSLVLGLLVMAVLVPLTEESLHRGLVQSAFAHAGPIPAVLISAAVFTAFHPPSSYGFVFLMGLVLGAQFWLSGSLWATMITHATYNGLVQIDWRCLQGQWNPPPDSIPQVLPGLLALAVLLFATLASLALLRCQKAGARCAPAPGR